MTVVFSDTFTDTDTTTLASHTPDTDTPGNGWLEGGFVGASVSAGSWTISSNAAVCSTNNQIAYTDIGQADMTIDVDWTTATSEVNRNGVAWRYTDTDNYWVLNIREENGDWRIIERNAGGETVRDSASLAWNEAQTYAIQCVITGNDFDTTIDGGNAGTYTSTFNNTETTAGLSRHTGSSGSAFDNFQIDDQAAASSTVRGNLTLLGVGS